MEYEDFRREYLAGGLSREMLDAMDPSERKKYEAIAKKRGIWKKVLDRKKKR